MIIFLFFSFNKALDIDPKNNICLQGKMSAFTN